MKRPLLNVTVVFAALIVVAVLGALWLWRLDLRRLRTPQSIIDETGLPLPESAHIIATHANLFSLVDGDNYEWLIQSETSLLPWVTKNMRMETGGWEHIRLMAEIDFREEMPANAKFGGVWRTDRLSRRGQSETSYLYLSDDGRVGILSTFRP